MHRAIIAAMLLLAAPNVAALPEKPYMFITQATVTDGDTFATGDRKIRLHGIDAPESGQLCSRDGKLWRCGQAAALALDKRLSGPEPVLCRVTAIDRYGRFVAVCHESGEDLNAWMVRQGWALAYRKFSIAYVDEEAEAQQARRGIWASEFTPPWDWRQRQREGARSTPEPRRASAPPARTVPKRVCCKVCRKGKPCGDSCISRRYTCHKGPGCAC